MVLWRLPTPLRPQAQAQPPPPPQQATQMQRRKSSTATATANPNSTCSRAQHDPFAQYANSLQEMVGPQNAFGLPAGITSRPSSVATRQPSLPVPSTLRDRCSSVMMADLFVDSMASMMILSFMPPGARVTNASPNFSITQVNGHVPVSAVVDVGIYIEVFHSTGRREWMRFDTRGVLVAPDSGVNLYSTRVFP